MTNCAICFHPSGRRKCLYCLNRKFCDCQTCFAKSFASSRVFEQHWDSDKNVVNPKLIAKNYMKQCYFKCDKCSHSFIKSPNQMMQSKIPCPFCNKSKLCSQEDCKQCYQKSFASHPKSKRWHQSLNGSVKPRDVFLHAKKYFFTCEICHHDFKKQIALISNPKINGWCHFCGDKGLCNDTNCNFCKNKTLASTKANELWDDNLNGNLKPRDIIKGSGKLIWLSCKFCNHSYNISAENFSYSKGCVYCQRRRICDNTTCNHCNMTSFQSSEFITMWSKRNKIHPYQVYKNSNVKYYFNCLVCRSEFKMSPNCINQRKTCKKCPSIHNKTEHLIHLFIKGEGKAVIREMTILKNKRFDLVVDNKIVVEIDGIHGHFGIVEYFRNDKSLQEYQRIDVDKMCAALNMGMRIIRISQEDVWRNKIDWKFILMQKLNESNAAPVEYIAKDPHLYDKHKELLQEALDEINFLDNIQDDIFI